MTPTVQADGTTEAQVWRALTRASFAVVSYVTPQGEPRSSGIVYTISGHTMYVAVAADGWKARHIKLSGRVAVTVPVRRGGVMSLLVPIPPATISFHASARILPAASVDEGSPARQLASLLPPERRALSCIVEIVPEGRFVTYGVGVPLLQLRDPSRARAVVPVT